jgi:hypothetical protein
MDDPASGAAARRVRLLRPFSVTTFFPSYHTCRTKTKAAGNLQSLIRACLRA